MKSKRLSIILGSLLILCSSTSVRATTISNYTVKSGDTLWKISKAYNTTISKIASQNNIGENQYIYPGQVLKVEDNGSSLYSTTSIGNLSQDVKTINYKTLSGDTVWGIAQKYGTTVDCIVKSNMLAQAILMPGQIITVPVNSTATVKPVGIKMSTPRQSSAYGDIYTWENARRLFTVGQRGTLKDIKTGIPFNIKYYGGSNHADIVPLTSNDSKKMVQIYKKWSWAAKRPMILTFNQGGVNYRLAISVTGMPHSTTDMYKQNWINGHFDMYFYNSTSHNTNEKVFAHQNNILIANGRF